MKYFLLIIAITFLNVRAQAQGCPVNIDFEQGSFNNWQCFIGSTITKNGQNVIKLDSSAPKLNRHEIISADSNSVIRLDEFGGFPKLCPYGCSSKSYRLFRENFFQKSCCSFNKIVKSSPCLKQVLY